jgi:3-methyladenine DNA glycosylase/8-oxoguanine DNA glycosylase
MAELYDLDHPDPEQLADAAEAWRPYRTWVSVLIRRWWEDQAGEGGGRGR